MSFSIGITGCMGRIGQKLIDALQSDNFPDVTLAGGTVRDLSAVKGAVDYFITDQPELLFSRADAVIDFTSPEATAQHARLAAEHSVILIAATSGLDVAQEKALEEAAQKAPIVYAANTSVGVNMLIALVQQAAARLGGADWDAEVIDIHHRFKVDAPSGTSYALARAIQDGRNDKDATLTFERQGHTDVREDGSIGFSVQRGGDTTIENTVIFFGNGERLELTHRAMDRSIFAHGAIRAALWAKDQKPALYSMRDMLEI